MRKLLITLVVLVALAVAADRGAEQLAESVVATRIQNREALAAKPDVEFGGFPFLTQVVDHRFPTVEVSFDTARTTDGPLRNLRARDVEATLSDVTVSSSYRDAAASFLAGSATVPYSTMNSLGPVKVAYAGQSPQGIGLLSVNPDDSRLPTFEVGVEISSGDRVRFVGPDGSARLPVPAAVQHTLASALRRGRTLTGLPTGFQVRSLKASPTGLELVLTGHDIPLT